MLNYLEWLGLIALTGMVAVFFIVLFVITYITIKEKRQGKL